MNLENIISGFEKKMEQVPWYIKLFNLPEYMRAKTAIRKGKRLARNYEKSERWYLEMGKQYNELYSSFRAVASNSYDMYDRVKNIPIIGNIATYYVKRAVNKNLNKASNITSFISGKNKKERKYEIPKKETLLRTIDETYETGLKAFTSYAAMETNIDERRYWNTLCKTGNKLEHKSLMQYMTEKIDTFSNLFNEMLTPQPR